MKNLTGLLVVAMLVAACTKKDAGQTADVQAQ